MRKNLNRINKTHPDALIIISSKPPMYWQHDIAYRYDPGANFRWLTQLSAHPCIIAMTPDKKVYAFLEKHDAKKWIWEGPRIDTLNHAEIEADHIYPICKFDEWFVKMNQEAKEIISSKALNTTKKIINLDEIINHFRVIKDDWEIEQIKHAIAKSKQGHISIMQNIHNDQHESSLYGRFLYTGYKHKAQELAYPAIIATGANASILHYNNNNCDYSENDWLLIDAGWRHNGYCSDISRSYPTNKRGNLLHKEIYNLVLNTQRTIIKNISISQSFNNLNKLASNLLAQGLIDLNIIKNPEEIIKYFPHSIGHSLGIEVHDPYSKNSNFQENMVITIEPGLYFQKNDSSIPSALRGFGIRIEDNILITRDGCINLSLDIPVFLDDIANV